MTQLPALLPGMVPLLPAPAPPELAAAPTGAEPFLALLAQLLGAPAAPAPATQLPEKAPQAPDDADAEPGDGDAPADEASALPVLPQLAAALVVPPPAAPPAPAAKPGPGTPAEAPAPEAPAAEGPAPAAPPAPLPAVQAPVQPPAPTTAATAVPTVVAPAAAPVTRVDAPAPAPAPVAHQVFPEVVRLAVSGETPTRVVVRLQPEHLGEVRVVLRTGRAGLEVSLAAGTDARAAIREGAPELRRMLEAAGSPDARIVVRHLSDAPTTPSSAAAPAAAPTPVRTDTPTPVHGLSVDVGAGTAGGTAHGDSRDRPQQDAPPSATDGRHDRPVEPGRPVRASGLDVMM